MLNFYGSFFTLIMECGLIALTIRNVQIWLMARAVLITCYKNLLTFTLVLYSLIQQNVDLLLETDFKQLPTDSDQYDHTVTPRLDICDVDKCNRPWQCNKWTSAFWRAASYCRSDLTIQWWFIIVLFLTISAMVSFYQYSKASMAMQQKLTLSRYNSVTCNIKSVRIGLTAPVWWVATHFSMASRKIVAAAMHFLLSANQSDI